jgi:hypothetical protein
MPRRILVKNVAAYIGQTVWEFLIDKDAPLFWKKAILLIGTPKGKRQAGFDQ